MKHIFKRNPDTPLDSMELERIPYERRFRIVREILAFLGVALVLVLFIWIMELL